MVPQWVYDLEDKSSAQAHIAWGSQQHCGCAYCPEVQGPAHGVLAG